MTSSAAPNTSADKRSTSAGYTALGWVVVFFAFHVYWYCGGSFASPGKLPSLSPEPNRLENSAGMHQVVAWLINGTVEAAWPVGALVCLIIARGWARGRLASVTRALAWVGCVLLLLRGGAGIVDDITRATGLLANGITGLSLNDETGHTHLRWSDWAIDWYFLAGGIIFYTLALRYRTHPRTRSASGPVPRWATRLAHLIPFMVLPSSLWRLAAACGLSLGMLTNTGEPDTIRGWSAVYIATISLLAEAVALTAFGLVRPLGEEVPRWLPFLGGRTVRPKAVIVAATAGAVALILIWTVGFWEVWTTGRPGPMASSFWAAVFTICYAPLNLWGPALLALTWAYRRRVTAGRAVSSWG